MRPILMKGHERPLTFLKYNRDGDLLFSCAKDHDPTVWFSDNGERLGTYRGHNGAVWSCDISRDSTRLITGSADQTAKIWDVETGTPLFIFTFDSPARAVNIAVGDNNRSFHGVALCCSHQTHSKRSGRSDRRINSCSQGITGKN